MFLWSTFPVLLELYLVDGLVPTACCVGFGGSVNTSNVVHPFVFQVVGMMMTLEIMSGFQSYFRGS